MANFKRLRASIGRLESEVAATTILLKDDVVTDKLGLRVEPLKEEYRERLNVEPDSGVLVTAVAPGMLAQQAGLQPGDVIGSVGDRVTRDLEEFRLAMEESDLASGIRMRVQRAGMNRFVFLRQPRQLSSR